ncbi:hypothetical protein PGB34_06190 [Xenophilus arseniciresistens]|uniref:Uncharacterized protein n=1 Tax=Xenophilus arseniciresistens TaxID=1283306 RepID=A0AAE3N4Z2_9BURK|nr:hypothetical protein [Xenophilus arseniciresistens]MDA7415950.1 hypothetical protein [Xenophilus arseniciresistens]
MFNFLLRVVLFLFGLLFAASIAVAALLLLAVWGARMAWAKLTGKPVTPWTVMFGQRFDPRQGFERFRAAAGGAAPRGPSAADVTAARARGESVQSPVVKLGRDGQGDVTDVRARPVDSAG